MDELERSLIQALAEISLSMAWENQTLTIQQKHYWNESLRAKEEIADHLLTPLAPGNSWISTGSSRRSADHQLILMLKANTKSANHTKNNGHRYKGSSYYGWSQDEWNTPSTWDYTDSHNGWTSTSSSSRDNWNTLPTHWTADNEHSRDLPPDRSSTMDHHHDG